MKTIKHLIGGLAGAVALNLLHQTVRQFDPEAPRVDLIGEEALSKGLEKLNIEAPTGDALFASTLSADLVSNAMYYSLIGNESGRHLVRRGIGYGLLAGLGAVDLTRLLGLNDQPVTRTDKTKVMTVAYYVLGGLVAGLTIKKLRGT